MKRWFLLLLIALVATGSAPAGSALAQAEPLPDLTGRQIMAFDPAGDGRVVEVVGDLATADRIAVIVPGAAVTARNFLSGLGGVLRRSPSWQATQLHEATAGRVAVVAWLGYDPPEGIGLAAARSDRASEGAAELVRFVRALAAEHPFTGITVIGHSYGSVVLGHAAGRLPAQVTDLVSIGSPGMDVGTAADLHTTARVWAGSAPDDWTLRLPGLRILGLGHGVTPTRPGFGARPIDATTTHGHDGYFETGSSSLRELARVAGGYDCVDSPRLRTITVATR